MVFNIIANGRRNCLPHRKHWRQVQILFRQSQIKRASACPEGQEQEALSGIRGGIYMSNKSAC